MGDPGDPGPDGDNGEDVSITIRDTDRYRMVIQIGVGRFLFHRGTDRGMEMV